MISTRFSRCLAGAITLTALLGALACGHTGPDLEVSRMTQRKAELDLLGLQAGNARLPLVGISGPADQDEPRMTTLSYEAWLHSADRE